MPTKQYPSVEQGEEVVIDYEHEDYKMACCDCGLVHCLRFSLRDGKLILQGWRDKRATGQIRRYMRKKKAAEGVEAKGGQK